MDSTNRRRRQKAYPCNFLRLLIRLWGIMTAIVLIGVGIDITYHRKPAGIYIIFISLIVFILETKWVFTLFFSLMSNGETPAMGTHCWRVSNLFSGWRLSPLYIALAVALLMWPNSLWLCSVVGVQLIILAILRLFTVFRFNVISARGDVLLQKQERVDYFEKLDSLSDIIDDSMPAPGRMLDDDDPIDV